MNFRLRFCRRDDHERGDLKKVRVHNLPCSIYFTCQSYDDDKRREREKERE